MSEYGGSDSGVDSSLVGSIDDEISDSGAETASIQDDSDNDNSTLDGSEDNESEEDEDEEEDHDHDHDHDQAEDLDQDLLDYTELDNISYGSDYPWDTDFDPEAFLRSNREHLHHHYHHHHHHGHNFSGLNSDPHEVAEDEEESLFVGDDDDDHNGYDYFGIGEEDLSAFDILTSFSPPGPGHSHSNSPLREILEAAAVFGAESIFHEPADRDRLLQFSQHRHQLHEGLQSQIIARDTNSHRNTNNSRTAASNMDRRSNGGRDELVSLEVGGSSGNRVQRSQQSSRPPAEVIDLTLDDNEPDVVPMLPMPGMVPAPPVRPPRTNTRRSAQRSVPPPNLTRSDTRYVSGGSNVIDLISSDSDEDSPTETGSRPAPGRRQQPPRAAARPPPPIEPRWLSNMQHLLAPMIPFMGRRNNQRPSDDNDGISFMGQRPLNNHGIGLRHHQFAAGPLAGLNIPGFGPIDLNYTAAAHPFMRPQPPPKPQHEPPKAAREGFTRDTGDDVVAMCPSCEEELAYDPDGDDGNDAGRPAKKARTRRDKAEHHFFAVKACGHVYCKKCYDHRSSVRTSYTGFKRPPSGDGRPGKKTLCAVDGCEEEVGNKSAWVGIFL